MSTHTPFENILLATTYPSLVENIRIPSNNLYQFVEKKVISCHIL